MTLGKSFSRWVVCALVGMLLGFVYAVLRVEPLAHDASLTAWQWFWQSYGPFFRRGLIIGGLTGLTLIWLLPAASRGIAALLDSRGRHLSWLVVFAIALPAGSAACGATLEGDAVSPVVADVVSVAAAGDPDAYQFAVGIASADTGCEQYANWWEVVSLDGELIYRRILAHSHVTEQPFVRSGGPVAIAPETEVWVRAYMHPTGYKGTAFKGSVEAGFEAAEPVVAFASELAHQEPQPLGCAN